MNEHERIEQLLSIFRDLSESERREVDSHLKGCASCRARLEAYQGMDRALSSLREKDLDTMRVARLVRQLDREERKQRRRPWMAWLAGAPVVARQVAGITALLLLTTSLLVMFGGLPLPGDDADGAAPRVAQTAAVQSASTPIVESAPLLPTATAPVAEARRTLTICMASEPANLWWAESGYAQQAILEAVQEPLVDQLRYGVHANLVEKMPSAADGDARVEEVALQEGDRFYDVMSDSVLTLTVGITQPFALQQMEGEPLIVEQWDGSPLTTTQVTMQWRLLDGLTWEDGVAVTSSDMLYGYELASLENGANQAVAFEVERTASFISVDDRTVEWSYLPGFGNIAQPSAFLLPFNPQPRHHYSGIAREELLDNPEVMRSPLSYGPYRIERWTPGEQIRMARNDHYVRGPAPMDEVLIRFVYPGQTILTQLVAGECDIGTFDAGWDSQFAALQPLAEAGEIRIESVAGTVFEHLDFNLQPVEDYSGAAATLLDNTGQPLFQNPDFRRAVAYCLDLPALTDATAAGASFVQHGYMAASHPYYPGDEDLTTYSFDPQRGQSLLAELGWEDRNSDGVREDLTGSRLAFVYTTRENPLRDSVTQVVQAQLLDQCGIQIEIELVGSELFSDGPDGIVFGRRYDVAQFAWLTGVEPPCDLYLSRSIPGAENGWNASNNTGFSDRAFDAACGAALLASDPAEKAALHAEALAIFTDQLPSIPLYARAKIALVRPGIEGVIMDPINATELWNIENFEVEE